MRSSRSSLARNFGLLSSVVSLATLSMIAVACSSSSSSGSGGDDVNQPDGGGKDATVGNTDGGNNPGVDSGSPTDGGSKTDSGTTNQDAGPPAPRYIGRTNVNGTDVTCDWSGCRAIARFHGTAASITIGGTSLGSSNYDVVVDGVVTKQISVTPANAATPFVLATGLPLADHQVEIYKRSEANDGIETYTGLTFPNGGTLLPPPLPGKHTIEFIGDSITAGFGVEGAPAMCDQQPLIDTLTNVHKSFAGVTATNLSADATFIAFSGKGVTRNFDIGDTQLMFGNAMGGMPDLYDLTTVADGAGSWAFKPVPDAVVLAMGADDFNNPGNGTAPTQAAFQAAYKLFLQHIRAKNPTSYIFATYSPSTVDLADPGYNGLTICKAAIPAAVMSLADAKIFYVDTIPDANGGVDGTGCLQHPNAAYHAKVATALTTFIKGKTGW